MSIATPIRDNWCRFQGELFPEIQDAVGPLYKKNQGFVMALEIVGASLNSKGTLGHSHHKTPG